MLELKGVKKAFGERILFEDVTLRVEEGQTLTIVGPSGCGKSTLLKCIATVEDYDKGSICLRDKSIEECKMAIGLNLQEHNLFPWLTVYKNISLGLVARKYEKDAIKHKVHQVANDLGIGHLLHCYPGKLSGGEKQRVGIARVLAYTPSLLLLDEPSSALDAMSKEKFQDVLIRLKKQYPITTVMVTHSIEEAVYLGDCIMVMGPTGKYSVHLNTLEKTQDIRKQIAFFNQCKEVRKLLEGSGAL